MKQSTFLFAPAIAGAALAALVGLGTPTASAAPGAAVNVSGVGVSVGDADADASFGNAAAAFNGGSASATGGLGNIALANGENSVSEINGGFFNVSAASGKDSTARVDGGSGNIVFGGRNSGSEVVEGASLNAMANFCNNGSTIVSAQSARITVSPGTPPTRPGRRKAPVCPPVGMLGHHHGGARAESQQCATLSGWPAVGAEQMANNFDRAPDSIDQNELAEVAIDDREIVLRRCRVDSPSMFEFSYMVRPEQRRRIALKSGKFQRPICSFQLPQTIDRAEGSGPGCARLKPRR